jgi:hypothetical protein
VVSVVVPSMLAVLHARGREATVSDLVSIIVILDIPTRGTTLLLSGMEVRGTVWDGREG